MSELSEMSNEDLQKEYARTMVALEGLQERLEEVMLDPEGDSENLDAQLQNYSAYLRSLEEEMHNRGQAGG